MMAESHLSSSLLELLCLSIPTLPWTHLVKLEAVGWMVLHEMHKSSLYVRRRGIAHQILLMSVSVGLIDQFGESVFYQIRESISERKFEYCIGELRVDNK